MTTGGERGIRTLDRILSYTPLAGARLRPLGHLSGMHITLHYSTVPARPLCAVQNAGHRFNARTHDHSAGFSQC